MGPGCAQRGDIYGSKRGEYGGRFAHTPNPMGEYRISHICAPLAHEVRKRSKIQGASVGQQEELQMDTVALQRWILIENSHKACEGTRRDNNKRLLKQIDGRWEVDRAEEADMERNHCRTMKNGRP